MVELFGKDPFFSILHAKKRKARTYLKHEASRVGIMNLSHYPKTLIAH